MGHPTFRLSSPRGRVGECIDLTYSIGMGETLVLKGESASMFSLIMESTLR
jgi:hypothetical protein